MTFIIYACGTMFLMLCKNILQHVFLSFSTQNASSRGCTQILYLVMMRQVFYHCTILSRQCTISTWSFLLKVLSLVKYFFKNKNKMYKMLVILYFYKKNSLVLNIYINYMYPLKQTLIVVIIHCYGCIIPV